MPLFVTPWTVACQVPLSMGFSRQEYQSGWPCPPPGDLSNPGIKPRLLYCRQVLYCLSHQGSPWYVPILYYFFCGNGLKNSRRLNRCPDKGARFTHLIPLFLGWGGIWAPQRTRDSSAEKKNETLIILILWCWANRTTTCFWQFPWLLVSTAFGLG